MHHKFYKLPKVKEITGLSRSTIYKYMENGMFPKQYKISMRSVAWKSEDIESWFNEQKKA